MVQLCATRLILTTVDSTVTICTVLFVFPASEWLYTTAWYIGIHKLQWRSAMIWYIYYNDSYSTIVISFITSLLHLSHSPFTHAHITHSHTLALLYIAKRWWAYMSHQNRPTLPSVVSHWGVLGRNGPPKLQCDLCKIPIIGWSDWTKMVDRHVQTKLS